MALVFGALRSMMRLVLGPVVIETLVFIKLSVQARYKAQKMAEVTKPTLTVALSPEILLMLTENLPLRQLVHFCSVCKLNPSAKAWYNALQSAIPLCTSLPVNHPMPDYYKLIAMWYFDPRPIGMLAQMHMCDTVLYLIIPSDLHTPIGGQPDRFMFNASMTLFNWRHDLFTKKGRMLAKTLLLELKEGSTRPDTLTFIDCLIHLLETAFSVHQHRLIPTM